MTTTISNLVNNLKDFIKLDVNWDNMIKNLKHIELSTSIGIVFLEYTNFKAHLIEYRWLRYNKSYQRKLDEKLKLRFFNTYTFSNHHNNKLTLLLSKGVYLDEYIDDWEKLNETSLSGKEGFYSHLNLEDITDTDYKHAKRICKDFEIITNLGEYHDLIV